MRLTGHVDGISVQGSVARILDHKTGRKDSDYSAQALGYCALVLLKFHHLTQATCTVLWIRDGEIENYTMDRAGLYEWLRRLEDEVVKWDQVWRPGSHCQYCPRSHECSAANALARRDMAVLLDKDLPGHLEDAPTLREMIQREPERVVELVEKARTAEKQAARVLAAVREEVTRSGDIVGGGKRLTMQERTSRQLDTWAAFPVLQEVLDDPEMAEIIDISLAKAEEIVAAKAGKGNGAAAKRALVAKLNEAEAIKTSYSKALVVRREA